METPHFENGSTGAEKQSFDTSGAASRSVNWTALLWLLPKLIVAAAITLFTAWLSGAQESFMVLLAPDSALTEIRPWVWVIAAAGLSSALAMQATDALGLKTPARTALLIVSVLAPVALIAIEFQWVLIPSAIASESDSNTAFFFSGIIISTALACLCFLKRFRAMAFFRTAWLTLLSFASMLFSFAIQSGLAIVLCIVLIPIIFPAMWIAGKCQIR